MAYPPPPSLCLSKVLTEFEVGRDGSYALSNFTPEVINPAAKTKPPLLAATGATPWAIVFEILVTRPNSAPKILPETIRLTARTAARPFGNISNEPQSAYAINVSPNQRDLRRSPPYHQLEVTRQWLIAV